MHSHREVTLTLEPPKAQNGLMETPSDSSFPREKSLREELDTGLSKIRHEIKSRLVSHGLFGTVTNIDLPSDDAAPKTTIQIVVKGVTAERTFDRRQIEDCRLRVGGAVLAGIVAMIEELSTATATVHGSHANAGRAND